jgi:benzodiazapine receptor
MMSARWRTIWIAATIAVLLSVAGRLLTDLSPWFFALRRPWYQPPDWLFGPAWTIIYACGTVAGASAWRAARRRSEKVRILALFGINGVFNLLWSWMFFTLQRPDWALIEVAFLWASIVALMVGLWSIDRRASLLITPYLLWVSFAAYVNYGVVQLNGPF